MLPWYFQFSWRDLYSFFCCCFLLVLCTVHWWRPSCLWVLFFGMLPLVRCTFPFSLGFLLLFFISYLKASWNNPFAFLLFILFGMALFTASSTVLWTSIHSSSGALLTASNPLNILVTSTAHSQGIGFQSHLTLLVVFPTFFCLSLNFAIRSWWAEPQSAPGLVFPDCIQLLHLSLQKM